MPKTTHAATDQVTVTAAGTSETFTVTTPGAFVRLIDKRGYYAGEGSTLVEAIADAEAMLIREVVANLTTNEAYLLGNITRAADPATGWPFFVDSAAPCTGRTIRSLLTKGLIVITDGIARPTTKEVTA